MGVDIDTGGRYLGLRSISTSSQLHLMSMLRSISMLKVDIYPRGRYLGLGSISTSAQLHLASSF